MTDCHTVSMSCSSSDRHLLPSTRGFSFELCDVWKLTLSDWQGGSLLSYSDVCGLPLIEAVQLVRTGWSPHWLLHWQASAAHLLLVLLQTRRKENSREYWSTVRTNNWYLFLVCLRLTYTINRYIHCRFIIHPNISMISSFIHQDSCSTYSRYAENKPKKRYHLLIINFLTAYKKVYVQG